MKHTLITVVVVLASMIGALDVDAADRFKTTAKQYGSTEADTALVYFIRPSHYVASARTTFLYSDRQFLGTIDNNSYMFAHVEPGLHLFWTNWTSISEEVEVVAGRTYYFKVWQTFSVLDEEAGRAAIEDARFYKLSSDKEKVTAQRHIETRYDRAARREDEQQELDLPTITVAVPENTDGLTLVPAGTTATLELMENVSSRHSRTGEKVLFRIVDDVRIGDGITVSKGTMVHGVVRRSTHAGTGGRAGEIDITIPALLAHDGTPIPVDGRMLTEGDAKQDAANSATMAAGGGLLGGLIGAAIVKGREAYALAGTHYEVTVREDSWVTARDGDGPRVPEATQEPASASLRCRGHEVAFRPDGRKPIKEITLQIESEDALSGVSVAAVGDLMLSEPLVADNIRKNEHGEWECSFPGWSLIRYIRTDGERTEVPIRLRGAFADGTEFETRTDLVLVIES